MDVYGESQSTNSFIIDDANVFSRLTKGDLNGKIKSLKEKTGYTVDIVTVRRLDFEPDAFQFGDKLRSKLFPDDPKGGLIVLVTAGKDGAVVGGPDFVSKAGEDFLDSVTGENIPFYADNQKFNEGIEKTFARLEAVL